MNINLLTACAALISALASFGALINSIRIQKQSAKENKQRVTIEAFNRLQDLVLDKMVSFNNFDACILVDDKDYESEVREAYDGCRTLIAKCEHFAVGVNNDVYDFDLVNSLGGMHLVYLYYKVLPIIENARQYAKDSYVEFEKLVKRLESHNNGEKV